MINANVGITRNDPMSEPHTFVSKPRFDPGDCLEGEHKVHPYIGFAHRPGFGLPAILVTLKSYNFGMIQFFYSNCQFFLSQDNKT